ncbi:hypothetical protein [Consotaella salsifontis]|uniref:Uncharacterized protein n=1 Tax=Consotaella salsifontis TaxID=1365950 RepID=A0A1T4RVZ0_9HYPH|nr:hypothetical protein [Consotaella salsifontis]SKA20140.1 hypothetical protein SAMN05428963_10817 [Consotaella salsifontis]
MGDRYISINTKLSNIIREMTTDELVSAAARRGYNLRNDAVVIDAIADLRAGRIDDAIIALDREFAPKFMDSSAAEHAYQAAMQEKRGRP